MNLSRFAHSLRPRLSPMRWAVLAIALVIASGTAALAVALMDVTGHPPQFSTQ